VQELDPAIEYFPFEQLVQLEDAVPPLDDNLVPAEHALQLVEAAVS
jgi:hypothetical protein